MAHSGVDTRAVCANEACGHALLRGVRTGGDWASDVWAGLQQQIYLGDEHFVRRMQKHLPEGRDLAEIPRVQRRASAKSLAAYAAAHKDRNAAMAAAYRSGHYSLAAIGRYFGVHYSTVSRAVQAGD